jgi:hypothetical protein
MAAIGNQRNQIADPMKTKTGKARLGPLGIRQLPQNPKTPKPLKSAIINRQ